MLTDTHAHLDFPDFSSDLDAILSRAAEAGVTRINTIGTSVEGSSRALELAEGCPNVYAVIGVHPNCAVEAGEHFIDELRRLAQSLRVVALGEAGLDYHRLPGGAGDAAIKSAQAKVFNQQLDLAVELGLNIVIHERDAWDDTLRILRPYSGKLRAVFHCFGKGPAQARELLDLGHMVSFTGIVTFKNAAEVQQTAREVSSDRFMFETDCPFLAPVPFRGKRCEPAFTREIAEHVARLRGEPFAGLVERTSRNASAFFRYPD
jgi:TatD DNase family protein